MNNKYKNKTYPLRIDNDLRLKIEYIANINDRTIKAQYERIIREFIKEYELKNGILHITEDGRVEKSIKGNVKPSTLDTG